MIIKIIRTILLIIAVLHFSYADAQYFNNKYQFGDTINMIGYSFGASAVTLEDGYFIGGAGRDSLDRRGIQLLKIDFSGNEIWRKMYVNPKDSFYFEGTTSGFIQTNDGGFALGGGIVDTNGLYNAMLYRFDENGDSLWFKSYSSPRYQTGTQCKQTTDGGFVIVGLDRPATGTNRDAWVLKTDNLGNKEWEQTYPLWNDELTHTIYLTYDGGYLLSGYTNSIGSGGTDAYVLKIDSVGNKEWERAFGGVNNERGGIAISSNDNGYLVGYSIFYNDIFSFDQLRVVAVRLDSAGNTIWEKEYGPVIERASVQSIVALNNGNYAFCIQQADPDGYTEGKVLIINENGDSLNYVTIRHTNLFASSHLPRSSAATNDGGLIISGATNESGGQRGFWVIKLDSMGCPAPNCFVTGISEHKTDLGNVEMKNYPNPFTDNTVIEITSDKAGTLIITDVRGIEVMKRELSKGNHKIIVDNQLVLNGVYFYSYISNGEIISTQRMIKL